MDNVSARMLPQELVYVIQDLHALVHIVIVIQTHVLHPIVEHPQVEHAVASLGH